MNALPSSPGSPATSSRRTCAPAASPRRASGTKYDDYGLNLAEVDPLGNVQYWHYDSYGHEIAHIDEAGHVTYTDYLQYGTERAVIDALGDIT